MGVTYKFDNNYSQEHDINIIKYVTKKFAIIHDKIIPK